LFPGNPLARPFLKYCKFMNSSHSVKMSTDVVLFRQNGQSWVETEI
jgi:hypothetical protein